MTRVALGAGLLALGIALVAGHIVYWYQPRVRPAVPQAGTVVADLLESDRFPAVLWLPYPHQNLGILMGKDGAYADYLGACARLVGLPPLVLPSFGSFPVVPAHEIALAADEQGEHFVVMARVYPAVAAFARLAGRIAGNPWLSGGTVEIRDRRATVSWDKGVWTVRDEDSRVPEGPVGEGTRSSTAPPEASLAVLALHGAVDPFPAGRYRLVRVDGSIEIVSGTTLPEASWQAAGNVPPTNLVLMMMAGARPIIAAPARALAFFSHEQGSRDLPRAAVFNQVVEGDRGRWEVPGEDLARLAGALYEADHGAWHVEALGDASLQAAVGLAPRLTLVAGMEPEPDASLTWALWANVPETLREVERLATMLEDLPLIPAKERERWRDAEAVLEPVAARFQGLMVAIGDEPRALRLQLEANLDPPPKN